MEGTGTKVKKCDFIHFFERQSFDRVERDIKVIFTF
jgi:hypothetical protein